jgi:putative RecB family exonuclease
MEGVPAPGVEEVPAESTEGRTRIGTPVDGERVLASLSPSRASDFRTCPLMYRLRTIDHLPEKPSPDAVRGTVVHKVLEDLFDLPAADRTPERADAMVQSAWEFVLDAEPEIAGLFVGDGAPGDGEAMVEWLTSCRESLHAYFALEDPRRLEPAERELYVETLLDSRLLLRGFVDRIDIAPDGAIRVVDYKTGRSPGIGYEAKALFQMRFYALVIWRTRGVVPALLRLVYLGDGQMVSYEPDEQDLIATERLVEAIWRAIEQARESREWLPSPGWACSWCSFQAHCPTFGNEPPPLPNLTTPAGPGDVAPTEPPPSGPRPRSR